MNIRKNILTIAGFDSTGGAGILADVKTFEQFKLQSFAIQTANTIQSADKFISPNWVEQKTILSQLDLILENHQFEWVKIGLIENLDVLQIIIQKLKSHNTTIKIIWDPILSASAGFDFKHNLSDLDNILKSIFLITPNWNEVQILSGENDAQKGAEQLAKHCKVYLKGGHNSEEPGRDFLYFDEKVYPFRPKGKRVTPKHGSGCVFSSALTANLAKGYTMIKSCLRAKTYVTRILESNGGLLGYHKF